MRLNAESALGLANVVMPSTSRRIRPSEARGAPRRGPVGAPRSGKSPDAIIWKSSSAHSLNVSSWRLGVRCAPRFVCRVMTATGSGASAVPVAESRRMHRDGAHARRHLLVPVGRRRVHDARAREGLGHQVAPLGLDLLADEVAVEQRRRARRPRVGDRHEAVVTRRHPQHDVREGEVGEQLQVADEHVQPVDVGLTAAALGEDEITEGRHRPSVVRDPAGTAPDAARSARGRRGCRGRGSRRRSGCRALSSRRPAAWVRTRIRAAARAGARAGCGRARTRGGPRGAGCAERRRATCGP